MVDRIVYAGNISEGQLGSPREPDPFKAESEPDKLINSLLYSSLFKKVSEPNFAPNYLPKLAKEIEVSNDKNTYKVTLHEGITFSDGSPITVDDVLYSLNLVPLEKNYTVEKTAENVLTFKIKKADGNFLEHLIYPIVKKDTTFGDTLTTNLVTSSFFKIYSIQKDQSGKVTSISLTRHDNGEAKLPYLQDYTIKYYDNEVDAYDAFLRKEIALLSGIPGNTISKIKDDTKIILNTATLPNNYSVFFNQNKNEHLQDKALRQALSDIVDRESLTNQVLGSFGIPQKNILGEKGTPKTREEVLKSLGSSFSFKDGVLYMSTKKSTDSKDEAVKIKLTTIQNEELIETAKYLQTAWKKIGIETEIQVLDRKDLNSVLKERDFEALLFGFSIKSEKDYYSFFSSKERTYPKLNISNYTSRQTDKILGVLGGENSEARVQDLLKQLSVEISEDNPIIILYKPLFVFEHFNALQIQLPKVIQSEEDRYAFVENWYTKTEKVFKVFNESKIVEKFDALLY
jgi:peptide/nickel transport system substrate-binding protein